MRTQYERPGNHTNVGKRGAHPRLRDTVYSVPPQGMYLRMRYVQYLLRSLFRERGSRYANLAKARGHWPNLSSPVLLQPSIKGHFIRGRQTPGPAGVCGNSVRRIQSLSESNAAQLSAPPPRSSLSSGIPLWTCSAFCVRPTPYIRVSIGRRRRAPSRLSKPLKTQALSAAPSAWLCMTRYSGSLISLGWRALVLKTALARRILHQFKPPRLPMRVRAAPARRMASATLTSPPKGGDFPGLGQGAAGEY